MSGGSDQRVLYTCLAGRWSAAGLYSHRAKEPLNTSRHFGQPNWHNKTHTDFKLFSKLPATYKDVCPCNLSHSVSLEMLLTLSSILIGAINLSTDFVKRFLKVLTI